MDKAEVELRQVTDAAVNQFGGLAARAAGEVRFIDKPDTIAARGSVHCDGSAGDSAADDKDVYAVALHPLQVVLAFPVGKLFHKNVFPVPLLS